MSFDRSRLPDPMAYYESRGLKLTGRGKWRTTRCEFHGGRSTMRVNLHSGAFACMGLCGARGGDVLAYAMAADGLDFVDACRALGAWVEDGKSMPPHKPTPLSARAALQVLAPEAVLCAVAAGNVARGVALTERDVKRLMVAAARITRIGELFA